MCGLQRISSLPICVICSEGIFTTELCCLHRITFTVEGVVYNELVLSIWSVCSEIVSLLICVACSEPVSLSNYVVCSELVSLLICVICSEGIFAVDLCCLQWIRFRYRMVFPAANQFSLSNRVVCSESVFGAEIALSAVNQRSPPKVRVLLWICHSLPKLSCLQWISMHCWKCVFYSKFVIRYRNWVVYNGLAFTTERVCSAANLWFAAEIELLVANACSELAFTAEIVLSTVNQHPLLKVCCLQRICDLLLKLSYL